MTEGDSFSCNGSGRKCGISSCFTCDSSGVVYLLGCNVCSKQYVGSTVAPFRVRFNNYNQLVVHLIKGNRLHKQRFLGIFLRQITTGLWKI